VKFRLLMYFFVAAAWFGLGFGLAEYRARRQFDDLVKASQDLLQADQRLKRAEEELERASAELRQALSECRGTIASNAGGTSR
jgi:hypothetical protein